MSINGSGTPAGRVVSERSRVFRYLIVGAAGFAVDGGILSLLVHAFGWGPYVSRIPSFLVAVTVTWWINRKHTFAGLGRHSLGVQYPRYVGAQLCGAATNLGVYSAAIAGIALCARFPVTALALGSAVELVVNYSLVRLYVFPGAVPAK